MLTSSTIPCAEVNEKRKIGTLKESYRTKIFSSLTYRVKIRSAIRYASGKEKGIVVISTESDENPEVS